MKNMTLWNIKESCGATLIYRKEAVGNGGICECSILSREELVSAGLPGDKEIQGGVVDSRLVHNDDIFFATPGERVDGHDFIAKAFEAGAIAAVCEYIPEGVTGIFLKVEDSFIALKQIAAFYRAQLDIKVVGITGSVGKTSTKEFIASVLEQDYKVHKTAGNFNNEVGLPLTVLQIRPEHEIAVLEMGISDFGEMKRLTAIARPDVCVITNIGQCHLENLGDRDGVLRAKTEIFEGLQSGGEVCLFGDDDKLATVNEVAGKPPVFFGEGEACQVRGEIMNNLGLKGSVCAIHTESGSFEVTVPLPGKHMVTNALAATAVGLVFGMELSHIQKGIAGVKAVSGRSNLIHTDKITIIDDCYNANPVSVKAALSLLREAKGRRVALLGDMFELGENEKMLHYEVGAYAAALGTDVICCIGALSRNTFTGAKEYPGSKEIEVYHYDTKAAFLEEMSNRIATGDSVLVKASHGMHFEELVEKMQA